MLRPGGVITMEFPHLLRLMEGNQFDTIYHEHFSYFSLLTTAQIFAAHGLELFDVEEMPTHGGSLRIYGEAPGGRVQAADRTHARAAGTRDASSDSTASSSTAASGSRSRTRSAGSSNS